MPKVSRVHLLEERSMPWSGELLIPRSERELRRSEGSGKLIDDPLMRGVMLARPTRRATYHRDHRARRSGELIPQNERETQTLRRERHAQR